jgi:RNA polymerase sigma-70 factor (ECF subfamily)
MIVNKFTKQYFLYRSGKLDRDAYAKVYDLYVDQIYRYIFFRVSSVQEAQDITSEVFLKTWEYLQKQKQKIENIEALLYRIARNLVIDFYRKRERQNLTDIEAVPESELVEYGLDKFHQQLDVKVQTQEVMEALGELNDLYREIIILKYIDQLTAKEISIIINKSSGATRVLIHRALNVLKKVLEKKLKND